MRYSLKQHELVPAADEPADAVLKPADAVETLVAQLPALRSIAIEFPGPSEGRGYTQARVLRERYGFTGELRAVGHVKRDQILFLVRCGFDAFELAAGESVEGALASLQQFTVAYAPGSPRAPGVRERFTRRC
ncbi:MAG: DUF934 domain-containing protein [Gammaproteobacteria bacterium]